MKISLIAGERLSDNRFESIETAAKVLNYDFERTQLECFDNFQAFLGSLGDVVIYKWDGSIQGNMQFRSSYFKGLLNSNKIILNRGQISQDFLLSKYYQQDLISRSFVFGIPTFLLKECSEKLNSPLILKPINGSKGKGIYLVSSFDEIQSLGLEENKYIVQPFIPNEYDIRVTILGGKVLAAYKRVRSDGQYLNNVSLGASVQKCTDEELGYVSDIALQVATFFDLNFVGVDIIRNSKTGEYFFCEINPFPQWSGVEKLYGIDVAKSLLCFCRNLYDFRHCKRDDFVLHVNSYYYENCDMLGKYSFHYLSRSYLWHRDKRYYDKLLSLEDTLLYRDKFFFEKYVKKLLSNGLDSKYSKPRNAMNLRGRFLERYPNIDLFNKILFTVKHSKNLFGSDFVSILLDNVQRSDLLNLLDSIENDKEAIFYLSTIAVNFIYNVRTILELDLPPFDIFIDSINLYAHDTSFEGLLLQIYLVTHVIIGETSFYAKNIDSGRKEDLKKMLIDIESIIFRYYHNVTLDCKLEFLVCCKLLGYESSFTTLIFDEAYSLKSMTDVFVDDPRSPKKSNLLYSEHRNVLLVMAFSDCLVG